ncbi:MAG: PilN domain-containing protein [Bacillota bacterium]|nr:PilN domain-containing protein [Bacillota bacterium]
MNYELNLHVKGSKLKTLFFKSQIGKLLLMILLFLFVSTLYGGSLTYRNYLKKDLEYMQREISHLSETVEPLQQMLNEIETAGILMQLEEQILAESNSWALYLDKLTTNVPESLFIENINCTSDKTISIRGYSSNMHTAASFQQKIEELEFIYSAVLSAVNLNDTGVYNYSIYAVLD